MIIIKYMTTKKENNLIPIPPGETLQELLDERGMSQAELANRIDRPYKTVNEIVKGKTAITPETSIQLEKVFGVPASVWNNLESEYQTTNARIEYQKEISGELAEASLFPYLEMQKLGWVPEEQSPQQRAVNLLDYFGVTSLRNIVEKNIFVGTQYRISSKTDCSKPAIMSWLRKGVIEFRNQNVLTYDRKKLISYIPEIRSLILRDPEFFHGRLIQIFSECGIGFVVSPNLPNAPVHGATRWFADKALIQLSIRLKLADIFWFSLFHEIGHILYHSKKIVFVDFQNGNNSEEEQEADDFASNILIPPDDYKKFIDEISQTKISADKIISFAKEIGTHEGTVVGRLQHDKIINWKQYNYLKSKLTWKNN